MKKWQYYLLFPIGIIFFWVAPVIFAQELPIGTQPVLPKEQRDMSSRYFDVIVKPGKSTTLGVQLKNLTDKTVKVKVTFNPAATTDTGRISYSGNKDLVLLDTADISKYLSGAKEVTLQPKQTTLYKATLTMPKEQLNGLVAGALVFSPENEEDTSKKSNQLTVENVFNYTVAVIARNVDRTWVPSMTIQDVSKKLESNKDQFKLRLENTSPTFLNQLTVESKVSLDGKEVTNFYKKDMQMAPESAFSLSIPLSSDITSGDYVFEVSTYYVIDEKGKFVDSKGVHYKYSTKKQIKYTVTQQAVNKTKEIQQQNKGGIPTFLILIVVAIVVVLLLILLGFFLLIRKQKEKYRKEMEDLKQMVQDKQ